MSPTSLLCRATIVLCATASVAGAETPEEIAEGHFNRGQTAYNLAKFDEAAAHFTKAYEALPLNDFLYNIAQSYRLGGNCKQALHMYKRFKSLKAQDTAAPMSAQKAAEVDKFITDLTECVAKADSSANLQPDGLDKPGGGTTTTTPANPTTTASAEEPDEDDDDDTGPGVSASAGDTAKLVAVRLTGGIALLSAGDDLDTGVQTAFNVTAGYPLAVGPVTIEAGVGLSYTPLPYEVMGEQQRGTLFGARATGIVVYPVASKLFLRGELGAGITYLGGLVAGNPITEMRDARSFTLPTVRVGVAVDYAIASNIVATIAPFAFSFSPADDALHGGSLREINVLVGVGYRQ